MTIISKELVGNRWVVVVEITPGNFHTFRFMFEPSTADIQVQVNIWIEATEYDDVYQIELSVIADVQVLKEFVIFIKEHPNIGMTGYNTYLNTLSWTQSSQIRFFVYKLAEGLSSRKDITLDDWTEPQILLRIRNWIVATPGRKIAKIVFGNTNVIT